MRQAGPQDQTAPARRPFEQNPGFFREFVGDRAGVPAVIFGDMQAGDHAFARLGAAQPVQRAIKKSGNARLQFAKRPFQKRIVAAGGDQRRLRLFRFDRAQRRAIERSRPEPGRDFLARKQQLAGHLADGQGVLRDEVVNLALFYAQ